jgi:hypothetical protein
MAAPVWRVEFDRAAVRDLRKLGADAEGRVLRYLRVSPAAKTRAAWVMRSPATARGCGATASGITESLPRLRTAASLSWWWRWDIAAKSIAEAGAAGQD